MKLTCLKILTFACLITSITVTAAPLDQFFQKTASINADQVHEGYVTQWVDHNNHAIGQFKQHYLIDESYSTSDADPVFLGFGGEWTLENKIFTPFVRQLAQKYHAKLIALEHRYYGNSIPFNNLSTANLQYLTYQNAMEDIVSFIKETKQSRHWTGKWVGFGGSYSAVIAAYFRETHPDLIVGSVASSAPVVPQLTFAGFDEHVTRIAGPVCADAMRTVVKEVEDAIKNNPERLKQIKAEFNAQDVTNNVDFLGLLAMIGGSSIQFGYKDAFCGALVMSKDPVDGMAMISNMVLSELHLRAIDLTPDGAKSENPSDYPSFIGTRQWYYQTCKEFGGWPISSSDPNKSTQSSLLDTEYNQEVCTRLFGIKEKPDTEKLYQQYYLPLLDPTKTSNIYFTNGSDDPWSRMSLIEENGNTVNDKLSYFMIEGGAHCDDLRAEYESPSLLAARDKMDQLIAQWLN